MSAAVVILDQELVEGVQDLQVQDQKQINLGCGTSSTNSIHGNCAICFNSIELEETATVKAKFLGLELIVVCLELSLENKTHAIVVIINWCFSLFSLTCILRWASYKQKPTCPQCKTPFEFLNIHRSLDGRVYDYMFEESVCLLLRASWFKPMVVVEREEVDEDFYDFYFEDEDEDLEEVYLGSSSGIRIGNRRWGDNGYVRAERQEARPVCRRNLQDSGAGPSRQPEKKEAAAKEVGRRAKRTLKREAADKAAAAKHHQHLARLGRTILDVGYGDSGRGMYIPLAVHQNLSLCAAHLFVLTNSKFGLDISQFQNP
ncbi:hypothetical protein Sango_0412000 [Sesamum angolense]|uniref:RING/U-box superfamily protein n=1 Tax=Sesamum angolense TaxID=2727404 RepID=A0AAE1XAL3_9LAMI|nr:hypothetical protein Sango_0412000 [Sesamum angolense]